MKSEAAYKLGSGGYFGRRLADYAVNLKPELEGNSGILELLENLSDRLFTAFFAGASCIELSSSEVDDLKELIGVVVDFSASSQGTPLILDEKNRLYLQRYYQYELVVAAKLQALTKSNLAMCDVSMPLIHQITTHFSRLPENELDYQQLAVFCALKNPFCVITGGPGTGKTTVLSAILALTFQQDPECRILAAAPTGKAANRMREALSGELPNLRIESDVKDKLAKLPCVTLHKLLGYNPGTNQVKYDKNRPLAADLVVIDECSMISVELADWLCEALPENCRLILLGDKDQLSSVDTGSVMADICASGGKNMLSEELRRQLAAAVNWPIPAADGRPLSGLVVELQKNFRAKGINIQKICHEIKNLTSDDIAIRLLAKRITELSAADFSFYELNPRLLENNLRQLLAQKFEISGEKYSFYDLKDLGRENKVKILLPLLDKFKILCTANQGPCGVSGINAAVLTELKLSNRFGGRPKPGTPIMILRNDSRCNLSNGDVGVVIAGDMAVFPGEGDEERYFSLESLPDYEVVFAMTIHKSQGSGFEQVLLILPPEQGEHQLLSRELIYTGISRAKQRVILWSRLSLVEQALEHCVVRHSGLPDRIQDCFDGNLRLE